MSALEAFDEWSRLVSCVDLHLSDEHLTQLSCKDAHTSEDCCATMRIVKALENVDGFGNSVKIHVLAQHVGFFAWTNRVLGALAEVFQNFYANHF